MNRAGFCIELKNYRIDPCMVMYIRFFVTLYSIFSSLDYMYLARFTITVSHSN